MDTTTVNLAEFPAQPPPLFPGQKVRTTPLTLAEMKAILARGESVLWNGMIIADPSHLPSEAQMAVGDPIASAIAAQNLQAQIDRLNADLKALQDGTLDAPGAARQGPPVPRSAPPDDGNPATLGPPSSGPAVDPVSGLNDAQKADLRRAQREALLRAEHKAANQAPQEPPPVAGKNVP